jgi:hypothetical protein
MRLRIVAVTYGRKLNTGNYSSATLEVGLWADLEEGEDDDEAIATLQARARNAVRAEYLRLQSKVQVQESSS